MEKFKVNTEVFFFSFFVCFCLLKVVLTGLYIVIVSVRIFRIVRISKSTQTHTHINTHRASSASKYIHPHTPPPSSPDRLWLNLNISSPPDPLRLIMVIRTNQESGLKHVSSAEVCFLLPLPLFIYPGLFSQPRGQGGWGTGRVLVQYLLYLYICW